MNHKPQKTKTVPKACFGETSLSSMHALQPGLGIRLGVGDNNQLISDGMILVLPQSIGKDVDAGKATTCIHREARQAGQAQPCTTLSVKSTRISENRQRSNTC